MRSIFAAVALFALGGSPALAGNPVGAVHPGLSATRARDIDGFALGMNIRDAVKRFTPTFRQGNQIQGKLGNIDLTFEVCPSGAIYFIETTQTLGQFIVDKTFLDALDARLFAKYGRGQGTPDNLWWELTEPVRYTTGEVHAFTSNRMSALVTTYGNGVALDLKMLDFRICWAESEKLNQKPRDAATEALKF
ncbi:MAG TPA: hypothetical protein VF098_10645 [Sphingomicrobium sp.]